MKVTKIKSQVEKILFAIASNGGRATLSEIRRSVGGEYNRCGGTAVLKKSLDAMVAKGTLFIRRDKINGRWVESYCLTDCDDGNHSVRFSFIEAGSGYKLVVTGDSLYNALDRSKELFRAMAQTLAPIIEADNSNNGTLSF